MHSTQPSLRMRAASWRRTPPDASSIQWASSTMTSTGPATSRTRSAETVRSSRVRRTASPSCAVSSVGGSSRPRTTPISGSHGTSSGAAASVAAISRAAVSSPSASSRPSASSSSSRTVRYGVDASYASQRTSRTRKSAACPYTSATRRDLPMPGSPTRSTRPPSPRRASASTPSTAASSASRPISGVGSRDRGRRSRSRSPGRRSTPRPAGISPSRRRARAACSRTGTRARSSTAAVASTWPGAARPITRAARFTASPLMENVWR